MGNCKVERAKLSPGFLPMGMKEYGGIIYIASYNPDTQECELGSFPSPERDITGSDSIENQTGLQDGYFDTDDYEVSIQRLMPSGEFNPEEITSKIQKLNEQEVLQLSPGDMYITTYDILTPTSPDPGAVEIDSTNFDDYFSTNESDKKTFSINFYKIDSGNNIVKIPNNEIKTIEYRTDIESDEYIYYTQTSAGSIAVEVALNTLSYFDSAVRETSRRADPNKKIRIEAVGETDSDIEFDGIRVDLIKNEDTPGEEAISFHIEKASSSTDKVSGSVEDFDENDIVKCDITPYNQYGYMPKLMQSFSLEIGRNAFGGGVNDVFKWRVDDVNNRLELDFDFKYDTDNTLKMYLEFYDTWSNVSTIRSIPAPSIYGPMRLSVSLRNDEARTSIYNVYPDPPTIPNLNHQKGGIPFSRLAVSNNSIMIPYLINPAQSDNKLLIRNDNSLRKNHFYIVRICGYEEDTTGGTIVRTFHDVYRCLYTSTIFNDIYQEQLGLSPSNPAYEPNFNNVPFPLEKIGYSASIGNRTALSLTERTLDALSTGAVTDINGIIYPFSLSTTPGPGVNTVYGNENIKYSKNYSVNIIRPDNLIYGALAANTLQITNTAGSVTIDPSKVSDPPEISADIKPNSTAKLNVPNLNSGAGVYNIGLTIETRRGVEGTVAVEPLTGSVEVKTLDEFMYEPTSTSSSSVCSTSNTSTIQIRRTKAGGDDPCDNFRRGNTLHLQMRNQKIAGPWTTVQSVGGRGTNDDRIDQVNILTDTGKQFLTVLRGPRTTHGRPSNVNDPLGLIFRQGIGTPRVIVISMASSATTSNFNGRINTFLKKFQVSYFDTSGPSVSSYYIIPASVLSYSNSSETKLTDATLEIKSKWNNLATKTYVFRAILKALGNSEDAFSTANINTIITQAIGRSSNDVINGTITDNGFIPYVDISTAIPEVTTLLVLDNEVISVGTIDSLSKVFRDSKTMYDIQLEQMNSGSSDTADVTVIPGITETSEMRDFRQMFKYSTLDNQLFLASEPGLVKNYAFNSGGAETKVRNIDMTSKTFTFI